MSRIATFFTRAWRKGLQALRDDHGALSPKRIAIASAGGVVVLGAVGGAAFALSSSSSPAAAGTTTTTTTVPSTSTTKAPPHKPKPKPKPVVPVTCPLTGMPAPGGKIPQRPVLAVKVGNDPNARPQSGLQDADVVYDTLAEGGITRYIAVYQCNSSTSIGPIRSVRWDDWHILQQFGHADLAFVHGINPDVDTVESLPWVCDLDDFAHPSLYEQNPARFAPEATYTTTASLWSACPKEPSPPSPFTFSAKEFPPGAAAVTAVDIDYNIDEANIVWEWSNAKQAFMHNYNEGGAITPDLDQNGAQLQAKNVVIELVNLQYGQYAETPGSTGDVESITEGSGTAYVLRDGRIQVGTWSRPSWDDVTKLLNKNMKPMTLTPGNTWVEIVPASDSITFTPPLRTSTHK